MKNQFNGIENEQQLAFVNGYLRGLDTTIKVLEGVIQSNDNLVNNEILGSILKPLINHKNQAIKEFKIDEYLERENRHVE